MDLSILNKEQKEEKCNLIASSSQIQISNGLISAKIQTNQVYSQNENGCIVSKSKTENKELCFAREQEETMKTHYYGDSTTNLAGSTQIRAFTLSHFTDLTNVKKRLFSNKNLNNTEKKKVKPEILESDWINHVIKNTPIPIQLQKKSRVEGNENPSKRKTRDFENWDEKPTKSSKRSKITKLCSNELILSDASKRESINFQLFEDKDLKIPRYYQRIIHESKFDEDCRTDSQQLELAFQHVQRELEEAVDDQKQNDGSNHKLSLNDAFDDRSEKDRLIATRTNSTSTDLDFRPINLDEIFNLKRDPDSTDESKDDLGSFHLRF